jgi:hypothetical protein
MIPGTSALSASADGELAVAAIYAQVASIELPGLCSADTASSSDNPDGGEYEKCLRKITAATSVLRWLPFVRHSKSRQTAGPLTALGMTRVGLRFWISNCLGNSTTLKLSSRPERTRISYFTAFSNGHVCDSPQREAHELHQRHQSLQEIRGSAVEGPAVCQFSRRRPVPPLLGS